MKRAWIWITQILLVFALVLFWVPQFINRDLASDQPFETVSQKVLAALDASLYPAQDAQAMRRAIKLDQMTAMGFWRQSDLMSAQELVIVQFDPDQKETVQEALNARQTSQTAVYEGYAPEQAEQTRNGVVDVENNYALYYVGDNGDQIKEAFINALEGH